MNSKSIQKAIATLITHPNIAENYFDFRNEVVCALNLNKFDINTLDAFYELNKEKFTASARILKKNRWDDIKSSLPMLTSHIEPTKLNHIWEDYIGRNNISELVSKNPLAESIVFAGFAENHSLITQLEQQLIKYERIRNEVTYKHHENFVKYSSDKKIDVDENIMDKLSVFIHDCYRIEEFEYDIPQILLKNKIEIADDLANGNYRILFYKNLNKEGVGTLKISSDIDSIIKKIITKIDLLAAYAFYQTKLTKNDFLRFLIKLNEIGVLIFVKH
jgi:hypothetical protein